MAGAFSMPIFPLMVNPFCASRLNGRQQAAARINFFFFIFRSISNLLGPLFYGTRLISEMNIQLYVFEYFTQASAVKRKYLAVSRPVSMVCVLLAILPAKIPLLTQVVPSMLVSICMDVG